MNLRRRFVTVDGLRIHVREAGPSTAVPDRPTVVLVHGFIISSRYMRPLARVLGKEGWHVVAPDLPGYGLSQAPADDVPGIPQLAEWLARILDALGERGRIVAIGNSMGCQIAVELARLEPARTQRLILLGPTFDPAASLSRHVLRLLVDMPREKLRLWALHIPDYIHAGPRRVVRTLANAWRHRIEGALPAVKVPVLVLRGSRDPIAPTRWVRQASELAPCGRAGTVPGAPHAANYSAPERVLRVIGPWLDAAAVTDQGRGAGSRGATTRRRR